MMEVQSKEIGKIAEAINTCMKAISNIDKNGWNDHHKYHFATDADILAAAQAEMKANGLALVPVMIDPKYNGKMTELNITYKLFHSSGQWMVIAGYGQGTDSQDKGGYKALTGALKYVTKNIFMMPIGGDDPEDDKHDKQRAQEQKKAADAAKKAKQEKEQLTQAVRNLFKTYEREPLLKLMKDLTGKDVSTPGDLTVDEIKLIIEKSGDLPKKDDSE